MSEEQATYDVKQAQAVLDADRQARAARCMQRIQAALAEERCNLQAFVVIDGKPVPVPVQVAAQ